MSLKEETIRNQTQRSKALILRYSDFRGYDTIKEHQEILEQLGYCWFGKFGKRIQPKYITAFVKNNSPSTIFLYTSGVLHRCKMVDYSYSRPISGFPDYYASFLFQEKDFTPHIFFKLIEIEAVSLDVLIQYVVVSSGKPIIDTLKKTISSSIMIQNKNMWRKPEKKNQPPTSKQCLSEAQRRCDSCIYAKNQICTNRRSINYTYECERPAMCVKRRTK